MLRWSTLWWRLGPLALRGVLLGALLSAGTGWAQADDLVVPSRPGSASGSVHGAHPAKLWRVVLQDGWRLQTEVLQPGSRSQGYHGELFHNGEVVQGTVGQTLHTPLGTLDYMGSRHDRAHLWSHSGWKLTKPAPGVTVTSPQVGPAPSRQMHSGDGPPGATLK